MNLAPYIADLLYENDCVVLPGFGALVANPHEAHIQQLTKKIYPPYKKLSFNAKLKENDGLLAKHVSENKGISYDDALDLIGGEIKSWAKELRDGKQIKLEHIGSFSLMQGKALSFTPSRDKNFLLASYGLSPVALEEIGEKPSLADKVERSIEHESRAIPKERIKYRVPALIYVFMSVPLLLYVLWLSTQTNLFRGDSFVISDLNPFTEKLCEAYKLREDIPSVLTIPEPDQTMKRLLEISPEYDYLGVDFKENKVFPNEKKGIFVRMLKAKAAKPVSSRVVIDQPDPSLRYHLITGCFSIRSNAERMVRKMRREGFNASIIDQKGGLYRVSGASFAQRAEATAKLDVVRQYSDGTWLLIK